MKILSGIVFCFIAFIAYGQEPPAKLDYSIKVGVEEVRLDAVVLDRKGKQITDLSIDDFEVSQDGRSQKVTSSIYINLYKPEPEIKSDASKKSNATPILTAPMLTHEEVRRTIVFLVDQLDVTFTHLWDARTAMRKFVETQMQPGDLISIIPSEKGSSANQLFTSDKRQLFSMIENVWWGMSVFDGEPKLVKEAKALAMLLSATSYCIRALQDMPGHKALIILSPNTGIPTLNSGPRLLKGFNVLADSALRADVVIHTLNIEGLDYVYETSSDLSGNNIRKFGAENGLNCTSEAAEKGSCFDKLLREMSNANFLRYSKMPLPLSQKTGGLFVENSNFFVTPTGIGRANEALKGYYLVTYSPPADTFKKDSQEAYRRIKMKVKRPGAEVHTRDGFFGTTKTADEPIKNPRTLRQAIFSPFRYNNLNLSLSAGYSHAPGPGYSVSSWLHLDGRDLATFDEKDGAHVLTLEIETLIADTEGKYEYSQGFPYIIRLNDEAIARLKSEGVAINIYTPIKNPGDYYVRAAVKDRVSGKIGSGYQFLEIPNLKKGRLSLSSIFTLNQRENASFIKSGNFDARSAASNGQIWHSLSNSSTIRSYRPGDSFEYAAVVNNAKYEKGQAPQLLFQSAIFKDGKEFSKTNVEAIDPGETADYRRIPIIRKLALDSKMEPGAYILQLTVSEKRSEQKFNTAIQAINFEIREGK